MVLRPRVLMVVTIVLLSLVLASSRGGAQGTPRPGEVSLPLKDYLTLVETVERIERERAQKALLGETPVAEVVSQRVSVVLKGGGASGVREREETATVTSELEVLIQGTPGGPVVLPVAGVPTEVDVEAVGPSGGSVNGAANGAAVTASGEKGEVLLVAPVPGRYAIKVTGPASLEGSGVRVLKLASVVAPVASTELDLPAELSWSLPGSVVVEDRVEGGRRKVRLTTSRGEGASLEVRRRGEGGEADKLLAQSTVLTLVQLGPEGPRRHDVVLYEVSRGGIASFTVDLPPGLAVEKAGTDEGDVVPVVDARRLTVHRRAQLRGTGYLVLTSTPPPGASFSLDPVVPEGTVRARYLALSSSVAADARPLPDNGWRRVDLDDLPSMFREALSALDLAAAWRLTGASTGLAMAVSPLPAAPVLPSVVRLRETTTLLTVDGTLLHRDRLTLRPAAGLSTVIDLTLPPAAILWSAKVDDLPVRPLERGNGTISIPLGFETGKESVVEVIAVLEKAIPKGRSELALELPRIDSPVQEHRWRLLLPDGNQYRFRSGDLRPARAVAQARDPWAVLQKTPGVLRDRINAGGNEAGQQSQYVGPGGTAQLRGVVTDEQGAGLPGVTVTVRAASFSPLVGVTDARGAFTFVGMPPGSYALQAQLEGFSTIEYPNVVLSASGTTTLEIVLGTAVEDVITVIAESPILDERRTGNTQTYTMDEGDGGGRTRIGRRKKAPASPPASYEADAFKEEAKGLQQGLVGGVKPLNIAIPESGKVLLLTGVLPPAKVGAELEVKAQKR
jgi:hypothetical protein